MSERFRHWCFTLNNYTEEEVEKLKNTTAPPAVTPFLSCRYVIFGKEVGESGTPHLQGFLSFKNPVQVKALHDFFGGRAHVTVARDVPASIEYCRKDGDFYECGIKPGGRSTQGKRNDLEKFVDHIANGGHRDKKKLRLEFPLVMARYERFTNNLIKDYTPVPELQMHPLRPWQSDLFTRLSHPPDPREIIFVVDPKGNAGKSWFAKYYLNMVGDKCMILLPGKKSDMSYAFTQFHTENTRVVFVDAPRSKQSEFIQYDILEELKNGLLFSPKYQSDIFRFNPVHVVVMMNEQPDMTKLSQDRYVVMFVEN